jgi:hypothetical protein
MAVHSVFGVKMIFFALSTIFMLPPGDCVKLKGTYEVNPDAGGRTRKGFRSAPRRLEGR